MTVSFAYRSNGEVASGNEGGDSLRLTHRARHREPIGGIAGEEIARAGAGIRGPKLAWVGAPGGRR